MRSWERAGDAQVRWYDEVDSTNDVAKSWAQSGAIEGSVVCAEVQSAGRGRRGAVWVCPAGEGLAFSVILRPTMSRALWPRIALVAGLAVAQSLEKLGLAAELKWPNDVLVAGKKICGVLVEAVGDAVIVGIGINVGVREFPGELAEIATSVWLESGREIEREDLLEEVVKRMVHQVAEIEGEFPELLDAWRQRCALTGKWVSCLIAEQPFQGMVRGVSDAGELLLEIEGQLHALLQADQIRVVANSRSRD